MIFTFFVTGVMGMVYAYGYPKTYSLFIPCAMHPDWNATRSVVFSDSAIRKQLLVPVTTVQPVQVSYFTFYFFLLFPLLSAMLINFLLLKNKKQAPLP
jgi:hypothetical protein